MPKPAPTRKVLHMKLTASRQAAYLSNQKESCLRAAKQPELALLCVKVMAQVVDGIASIVMTEDFTKKPPVCWCHRPGGEVFERNQDLTPGRAGTHAGRESLRPRGPGPLV